LRKPCFKIIFLLKRILNNSTLSFTRSFSVNVYGLYIFFFISKHYENRSSVDYTELGNLHIINTGIFIIKNNDEMKELINLVWNTKTNTNIGLFDPDKVVTSFSYDDWPFEQGAFHVVFSDRKDIEILPDKSFNYL